MAADDYIDCSNKNKTPKELFKMLLSKVGLAPNEVPAIRVCISNVDEVGGQCVDHFVATAGQTDFVLANNIRKQVSWFRNGSIMHSDPTTAVVGQKTVELPAQVLGSEITILS